MGRIEIFYDRGTVSIIYRVGYPARYRVFMKAGYPVNAYNLLLSSITEGMLQFSGFPTGYRIFIKAGYPINAYIYHCVICMTMGLF